jgi:hypothetical protein
MVMFFARRLSYMRTFWKSVHQAMTLLGSVLFLAVPIGSARAEQFSIKCPWIAEIFLTFDEEGRRVIQETTGGGWYKGVIDFLSDEEIKFHLLVNHLESSDGGVWNRRTGSLVPLRSPNEPGFEIHCSSSELRPVMSHYDDLRPR